MNEINAESALAGEILADDVDAASHDEGFASDNTDSGATGAASPLKAVGYAAHHHSAT